MRIACPHCAAVYAVPDQALARAPLLFRCARCAFQWAPQLPPPPPELVPPELAPPELTQQAAPRVAPAMAAPVAVMEIPPRPALPSPSRLEAGAPLLADSRPPRVRSLRPAPLAASFGLVPLDGDPRGSPMLAARTHARSLGTAAGVVGWVLTVAIVVAVVALALLRQPQIEAVWPPSQRLYALLGLR